jgi:hypothetical protein
VGNPQPTSGISCEFKLLHPALVEFEALRGLLRRVAEEVEAEIKQVVKELAEARRGGAGELAAVRDIRDYAVHRGERV